MKKLLVLLMVIAMMFSVVACGSETDADDDATKAPKATATATATATAEPTPTEEPGKTVTFEGITFVVPKGLTTTEAEGGILGVVPEGGAIGVSTNYMTFLSVGMPASEIEKKAYTEDKESAKTLYETALKNNTSGLVTEVTSYDVIKIDGVDTVKVAYDLKAGTTTLKLVEYMMFLDNDVINVGTATSDASYIKTFEDVVKSIKVK